MKALKEVMEKGTPNGTVMSFTGKAARVLAVTGPTIHQLVNKTPEETEMRLFMLVLDEHLPIPDGIEVVVNYGLETVRTEHDGRVRGNCMYLRGEPEAFVEWLQPFDGIWTTKSPMLGQWEIVHVKENLEGIEK
jgi:hypothetical protein